MSSSAATIPEGPGSVSGAPNLPDGFTGTFTSRYVDTGEVRLHAVTGGDGPPLLLVHGWPQTWYAWRMLMPALARDFSVVAVDQRGIGLSGLPQGGYDTATLAADLVALMDALGHRRFALYGTDVGMPIAYALAADHRDRVDRLVVSAAPLPGISPSPPLFLPPQLNEPLWHLAFNQLPKVNEQLVTGREEIFFGAEFDASAGTNKLPAEAVRYYIDTLAADADHLRGSFGFYRAIPATIAQNEQRKTRRLTLPVLAIGGAESSGEGPGNTMKLAADDVQTMVIPGCGHWVAEQAPGGLLAALTAFLAPTGTGRLRNRRCGEARGGLSTATPASTLSERRRLACLSRTKAQPAPRRSARSRSRSPKKRSPTFGGASPRHACPARSWSPTGRRACSWQRSGSSPATGRASTTGARARRN
jgi:pimeloyl-ACP methyl ester carboxylesterase